MDGRALEIQEVIAMTRTAGQGTAHEIALRPWRFLFLVLATFTVLSITAIVAGLMIALGVNEGVYVVVPGFAPWAFIVLLIVFSVAISLAWHGRARVRRR
jgi:hypothetical protein